MDKNFADAADRMHTRLLARIWQKTTSAEPEKETDADRIKRELKRVWLAGHASSIAVAFAVAAAFQ